MAHFEFLALLKPLAYSLFITLAILLVINGLILLIFDTYRNKCKKVFKSHMNKKTKKLNKDIELDTIREKKGTKSNNGVVLFSTSFLSFH